VKLIDDGIFVPEILLLRRQRLILLFSCCDYLSNS
jgi:hypothetical protein